MTELNWAQQAVDGAARLGVLRTGHGMVETPAFMAVGTRGTVKTVDSGDLEHLGAQIVLANTYHLMLRPGTEVVAGLGGLHDFMAWRRPILTDSGGFQVLSLQPRVEEHGVTFRSVYDGSTVELTPEAAVAVQEELGADIAMVLDVPVPLPADRAVAKSAMERTLRWAERSLAAKSGGQQALFGIVQGGSDPGLRAFSAQKTAALGFTGFGIGGLSVGESTKDRDTALDAVTAELPADRVRYVMGLGDAAGLLEAVARGADLFDCVLPTRLARHGKALTPTGDVSLRRAEHRSDDRPIEAGCDCPACGRYSRGYLRHLHATKEPLGRRLLTLHNLAYTYRLMRDARRAIAEGRFESFKAEVIASRGGAINKP